MMHPINEIMMSATQRGYKYPIILALAHSPHMQTIYSEFSKRKILSAYDLVDAGVPLSSVYRLLNKMKRFGLVEKKGWTVHSNKTGRTSALWRLK